MPREILHILHRIAVYPQVNAKDTLHLTLVLRNPLGINVLWCKPYIAPYPANCPISVMETP